jgi:hypothetical protein
MKAKLIFTVILGAALFAACSKTNEPLPVGYEQSSGISIVPFTATFNGTNAESATRQFIEPGTWMNINESGSMVSSVMGDGSFDANFLFDIYEVKSGYATLQAANGDKLYVYWEGKTCKGGGTEVNGKEAPDEICCWHVKFQFRGGTGIYTEAHGGGMTSDYYGEEGYLFHHNWKGTLVLQHQTGK